MKKTLSLILALLMVLTSISASGILLYAEEEENVALGKTVMGGGTSLDAVTDGRRSNDSYWDGGLYPAAVLIDLEGFYDLHRINVVTYYGDGRSYKYKIEGSDDGLIFFDVAEKSDSAAATAEGTDFPVEVTTRYLRVTITGNTVNGYAHLIEVSAYGTKNETYVPADRPKVDEKDPDNLAYLKPVRSNSGGGILNAVNDGNEKTAWEGEDYPRYIDVDLMDNYELREMRICFPTNTTQSFTVYGSTDGVNFKRIAAYGYTSTPSDGKKIAFEEGSVYRILRISLTGNSAGGGKHPAISEVRVYGTKSETPVTQTREKMEFESYGDWLKKNCGVDLSAISDAEGKYDVKKTYTEEDTKKELNGIVTRLLGEKYVSWFDFSVKAGGDAQKDHFRIEDKDGKIAISGDDGVCIAAGLNWYLKYFCGVHISQETKQVRMPEAIVKVGQPVEKETKLKLRYAYNYCTLSYTMAFFGYEDWRRELDWLYLNGINLILDTTATEALWVEYLQRLGYNADDAKNYVCGYAYKAWWLMGNLEGYGGTVSDMWIYDTLEMARVNQRSMTVMGARPALQAFVGAMPQSFRHIAKQHLLDAGYPDVSPYMAPQGSWAGALARPNVLRTDYEGYSYLAKMFYDAQEFIYGQVTDYFCGDVCHEGGIIPEGLKKEEMSAKILSELMAYDRGGVWILQRWWDNPLREVLDGFGEYRTTNILVLDLNTAQTTGNFTDKSKYGAAEFGGTAWIASTLDNYGGNPGAHASLQRMCANIIRAKTEGQYIKGLGMTPEGTQNNPVMMDLYWELVWLDETPDVPSWIEQYAVRRYGSADTYVNAAWKKLYATVYSQGNADDGATVRFSMNSNPHFDYGGGYYEPKYRQQVFYDAIALLAKSYDKFKDNECYIYDLTEFASTYLATVATSALIAMKAIAKNPTDDNIAGFAYLSEKYLDLILLIDEIGAYTENTLLGKWIGRANEWMEDARTSDYDDYSEDMMVFNAKSLISAWHSATLIDYANRRYNGLMSDYYYQSWSSFLESAGRKVARKQKAATDRLDGTIHFNNAWKFIVNGKIYRSEALPEDGGSDGRGLKAIIDYIAANYQMSNYKNQLYAVKAAEKGSCSVFEGMITGVPYGSTVKEVLSLISAPEGTELRFTDADGKKLGENDAITSLVQVDLYKDGARVNALKLKVDPSPAQTLPFGVGAFIGEAAARASA